MIKRISISIDPKLLQEFDAVRGMVKRSTLIGELMRREITVNAVRQDKNVYGTIQNHQSGGAVNE